MPVMRGRDAVKEIRNLGYEGVVIGVTANVLQADIEDFITQGADNVIKKPLNAEKFLHVLTALRSERRQSLFTSSES